MLYVLLAGPAVGPPPVMLPPPPGVTGPPPVYPHLGPHPTQPPAAVSAAPPLTKAEFYREKQRLKEEEK